jgi:hypothetical protein
MLKFKEAPQPALSYAAVTPWPVGGSGAGGGAGEAEAD